MANSETTRAAGKLNLSVEDDVKTGYASKHGVCSDAHLKKDSPKRRG
jgi:hypothetical protein